MGYGISVDVSSFAEQTLFELSMKEYPASDGIYARAINSASIQSEIYVIQYTIFSDIITKQYNNAINLIRKSLENLVSKQYSSKVNSAALLCKILPFIIEDDKSNYFLLSTIVIFGEETTPGLFIIENVISFLRSVSLDKTENQIELLDSNIDLLRLLNLVVSSSLYFNKQSALLHTLFVEMRRNEASLFVALLNYIHNGGKDINVITLVGLLINHEDDYFLQIANMFVENGGCLTHGFFDYYTRDKDKLLGVISSLPLIEHYNYDISPKNSRELNLALSAKLLIQSKNSSISNIIKVHDKSPSLLTQALYSLNTENKNCENLLQIIERFDVIFPSRNISKWIVNAIIILYIIHNIYLFQGINIKVNPPNYDELNSIVYVTSI